ncbi:hypothetical protein FB451DRAFT_1223791 [Mycena latifolia]|nr:hypothetical protein FB451DRAFT_1223791 [Mycena latifolia]
MTTTYTIIDDQDPAVSYTGTWVVGGTTHEHDGTVSSSVKAGDHFSVPFTGTGISVYGTFDSSSAGVKTSYAIDGGSATTVTSSRSNADSFQRLFWQSNAISNEAHTLVVTMLTVNDEGDGEGTVWFDYFNVSSPASSSSSASSSTGLGSHTASATSAGSSSSSSGTVVVAGKKSHLAAIIGGVVGGILLIALICAVLLLWRRRRQKHNDYRSAPNMSSSPPIQPFLSNPTPITPISAFPASPSFLTSPYPSSSSSSSSKRGPPTAVESTAPTESVVSLKRQQQQVVQSYEQGISGVQRLQPEVPPIQHVDSGVRALDPTEPAGPAELPPVYTAH